MNPAQQAQRVNPSFTVGVCESVMRAAGVIADMQEQRAGQRPDEREIASIIQPLVAKKEIAAADVVAWLNGKASDSGVRGLGLLLSTSCTEPFIASVLGCGARLGSGKSPEEAIAKYVALNDPSELAEKKRREAAELLAEAEALAPSNNVAIAKLKAVVSEECVS